jgi:cullin-associated NEDD8-dissociated protein 1
MILQQDLIREVEMGPFKHTVDDGLDLRKAAFECMYTLLDSPVLLPHLDLDDFLDRVDSGLRDHHDIKMLTYLMLSRLAYLAPHAILTRTLPTRQGRARQLSYRFRILLE